MLNAIFSVQPLVCIDFGNTFTKVAVRPNEDEESLVVRHADLQDEWNLCIPTVVARRRGTDQWFCGPQVARLGDRVRQTEVFRNWKPALLGGERADEETPVAAPLADADWETVKAALGVTDEQRASVESLRHSRVGPSAQVIAVQYFRWLHGFVAEFCDRQGWDVPAEGLEARITLPAFDGVARGEAELLAALAEAGWRVAAYGRSLPEPVANTIGVLTVGRNAIVKPAGGRKHPWWIKMFSKKDPLIHSARDGTHWLLVVDLGSFTTDFALMGFEQRNLTMPSALAAEGDSTLWRRSDALGVSDLDRAIAARLGGSSRAQFLTVANSPGWEVENVHKEIYGAADRSRPVAIGGQVVLLADDDSRRAIDGSIAAFADEVAVHLGRFLDGRPVPSVHQVVLTGGGMNIPEVRRAILLRLAELKPAPRIHAPGASGDARLHALEPANLVRSATALGGTSVYFDFRAPAPHGVPG